MKGFIKDKYHFISFAVALIPSILLWIFQPTDNVPYWLFAVIVLISLGLLWLALMAYFHCQDAKNVTGLSVINCSENIVLCRPNPEISLNVIVTIYELKNQYERILGYGYVQNIQQNGIIQIAIKKVVFQDSTINLIEYIGSNTSNIIIKTVATIDILNVLSEQERS